MTLLDDDFLDDLFLGCAFAAYVDQAIADGGWPECEATRHRACQYYEAELTAKHGRPKDVHRSCDVKPGINERTNESIPSA